MDAAALAAVACACSERELLTGTAVRAAFRVELEGLDGGSGAGGRSDDDGSSSGGTPGVLEGGSGGVGSGGALAAVGGAGGGSEAVVVECLWRVLDAWAPQQLAGFLRFVTGVDRCACGRAARRGLWLHMPCSQVRAPRPPNESTR